LISPGAAAVSVIRQPNEQMMKPAQSTVFKRRNVIKPSGKEKKE
jgi:hypothetical protein